MNTTDILALSACDVVTLCHQGRLKATDVTQAYQQAIADRDGRTGAWHTLAGKQALAYAQQEDRRTAHGALAGIPFGIKDVIETADLPTGYGSSVYNDFQPVADAACVALIRQAGGVVLGKTVSTEFAMASPNGTRNPHNPAHTPGGSSSGSCAAVADGTALAALGTQTSGSVIRPAAYCGVVGYKPSYGMLNTTGIKVLSHSLDTLGILARHVGDAALVAGILGGRPDLMPDPQSSSLPHIGIFCSADWHLVQEESQQALVQVAQTLSQRGGRVSDISVPTWFDSLFMLHDAIMGWEVTQSLAYERLVLSAQITAVTRDFLALKATATVDEYRAAQAQWLGGQQALSALFGPCDVLVTPAAPGEAPMGLASTGDPFFNRAWTLLHVPCLTLPVMTGPRGLPVGIQLIGKPGEDRQLLQYAAAIEMQLQRVRR